MKIMKREKKDEFHDYVKSSMGGVRLKGGVK